jgi:hypothetical protein
LAIDIAATPCQLYTDGNCSGTSNIKDTGTGNVNIANLAIGDIFQAGDYEITVTKLSTGSQATGYTGEGLVQQNLISGIKIPLTVKFKKIQINECYQFYNHTPTDTSIYVKTKFDESWGGVVAYDDILNDASTFYKNAITSFKETLSLFKGTCDEIRELEKQIAFLEKGYEIDNSKNDPTSTIGTTLSELKLAFNSLKSCSSCVGSSNNLRNSLNSDNNCESKVTLCSDKINIFQNLTILNNTWLVKQGCENFKKATVTPCSTTQIENCFRGGGVYVTISTSSSIILDGIKTNCISELKSGQWLILNGKFDDTSFDVANRYNIENNKWGNYVTIADRHKWYEWADDIAKPRDNYWFAAAADVTSWRAVGGAELEVNLGYITDPEEFIMKAINKHLIQQNFENFGPYVTSSTGKVKDVNGNPVNLSGVALAEKMVEIEQTEVQNYLPTAKNLFINQFGNQNKPCYAASGTVMSQFGCAIYGINKTTVGENRFLTDLILTAFTLGGAPSSIDFANLEFKKTYPGIEYNFLNYVHRVFMGKAMATYLRNNP